MKNEKPPLEIIEAMQYIKDQHNGELPYKFGTVECATLMAKYLEKRLTLLGVSGMFSEEQMGQAFCDGVEAEKQQSGDFDIENYR